MSDNTQLWDLWFPQAGATGLPFGRGRLDPTQVLLVHAAPPALSVSVSEGGKTVARGEDLARAADTPMARLTRRGEQIEREDIWPGEADLGLPVLLAGGEVGILKGWWHADDQSEWRWQIELYNRKG